MLIVRLGMTVLIFSFLASIAWGQSAPSNDDYVPPPPTEVPLVPAGTSFLEAFPNLKQYTYEQPNSGFYLGFGLSPIGLLRNKFILTANFFELHWIRDNYDLEILNASYSLSKGQSSEYESNQFTFRTAPKYRIFGPISVGPLVGYELISFPHSRARIYKAPYIEPNSEPFSSRGWIYGLVVSETFKYGPNYLIKCDQLIYHQTYSATTTGRGWDYLFDNSETQQDRSRVGPGTVIMVGASLLY